VVVCRNLVSRVTLLPHLKLSDLFGYCLARQCAQILNGENDVLEFGAGSGILATQVLFELGRLEKLPNKYYILELSAELKHRQKETITKVLPELLDRVVWLNTFPDDFSGVVIANEVLDAMPAKRLIKKQDNFVELGVDCQNDQLQWQMFDHPYTDGKVLLPNEVEQGYTTEVNLRAMAWVESLSDIVDQGLVLLIDYGMGRDEYFHPQRGEGTLRCYYQHKASDDPFMYMWVSKTLPLRLIFQTWLIKLKVVDSALLVMLRKRCF